MACINRNLFFHGDTHEFFENKQLLKPYSESTMQAHMHLHEYNYNLVIEINNDNDNTL